jgi:phage terminase large subunit GpA-like protein
LEPSNLLERREEYPASPLPAGVCLLTAGVDIQRDRFEMEVVGWGRGEECWSLAYIVHRTDPTTSAFWEELDRQIALTFHHPLGEDLRIVSCAIDSGGWHTQDVYRFAGQRWARGVRAIKGEAGEAKPIVIPSKNVGGLVRVGVDTAKSRIMARLQLEQVGPGYCHFPTRHGPEYFDGLTSERLVTHYVKGYPVLGWERDPTRRNEPLDCRVYAIAALEVLNVDLELVARGLESRAEARNTGATPAPATPPRVELPGLARRMDWVRRGRG